MGLRERWNGSDCAVAAGAATASALRASAIMVGRIGMGTGGRKANRAARSRQGLVASVPVRVSRLDRKSTRLNSSHGYISYAVFCLKKKIVHEQVLPLAPLRARERS